MSRSNSGNIEKRMDRKQHGAADSCSRFYLVKKNYEMGENIKLFFLDYGSSTKKV